ncbi:hypothetical protein ACFL1R_07755 [Candidatus Latescibacterota bacterium]
MAMKDLRKSIEDNYLSFILIATASVAFIAALIWCITIFVKKVKK